MHANTRALLERCIDEGLERGYRLAHKHTDKPSEEGMRDSMWGAIWLEIDSYFSFEGEEV
jgi:hypothetical protein